MKYVLALMMAVTLCGSASLVAQNLANPPVMELTLEPGKVPLKTWKEQPVALIHIQAALAALPNPESLHGTDDLAVLAASAMDTGEAGNYKEALAKAKRLRTSCEQLLDDPKSSAVRWC